MFWGFRLTSPRQATNLKRAAAKLEVSWKWTAIYQLLIWRKYIIIIIIMIIIIIITTIFG